MKGLKITQSFKSENVLVSLTKFGDLKVEIYHRYRYMAYHLTAYNENGHIINQQYINSSSPGYIYLNNGLSNYPAKVVIRNFNNRTLEVILIERDDQE